MIDFWRTLVFGANVCADCGTQNFKGLTYCRVCGQRILNRNPLLRWLVTILALATVAGVIWWKLKSS